MRANYLFTFMIAALCISVYALENNVADAEEKRLEDEKPSDIASKPLIDPSLNPLGFAFGTIYKYMVMGYTSLGESAYDVYDKQLVTGLKKLSTNTSATALAAYEKVKKASAEIKVKLEKKAASQKEEILEQYKSILEAVKTTSAETQEKLKGPLAKMTDIVIVMQDPDFLLKTDEAKLQAHLTDLSQALTSALIEENKAVQDEPVSFMENTKSRLIRAFNFVIRMASKAVLAIADYPNLATLFAGLVVAAALYLSYRLGLGFFRVLVWISSLPLRFVRGLVRYIFGYSSKLDFDADEEALREACADEEAADGVSAPLPRKQQTKSAARRLDGADGLDTATLLEANLVEDDDDSFETDLLEDELAGDDDLAAADESATAQSSVPTVDEASSAAMASTLAATVAAVALFL